MIARTVLSRHDADMAVCCHAQVMSSSEIEWVNQYHQEVWDKASPRLSGDVLEWLRANTAPLQAPIPQVAAQA